MPDSRTATLSIAAAAAEQLAFDPLLEGWLPSRTVPTLTDQRNRQALVLERFVVAKRDRRLVGAVRVQIYAAGYASISPPRLADGEPTATNVEMLREVETLASQSRVTHIRALVSPEHQFVAECLHAGGFRHVTDIAHLVSLSAAVPQELPTSSLRFHPREQTNRKKHFAAVMSRTLEDTLDCASLLNLHGVEHALESFRASEGFRPHLWFIARHGTADAGCLILADHPSLDQIELQYMGLFRCFRGLGKGGELIRFAQWSTRRIGREKLIAAVDVQNDPAIACYSKAGFLTYQQSRLFIKAAGRK